MDVQQISTRSLDSNLIEPYGLNTNENSYTQLKSIDYNQIHIEQAQFQSQNKNQAQAYVPSGQLVSMSGVIENGLFIPIQLNSMTRSISNNSVTRLQAPYHEINENQLHIPSTITYQCSSPLYQPSTNVRASPSLLTPNIPPSQLDRMKRGHHDVSSSIENDISVQEERWQTARGSKKINRSAYNSNNTNAASQYTTVPANIRPETYRNQTFDARPQNIISNGNDQVTTQAQRYAMTRYPFSPFVIHFKDHVRDKLVIEHLVKHSKERLDFDLKIIGYRRSQVNCSRGEYDVLVFVETTDSFEFLFDDAHWPSQLVGKDFTLKKPSIPPQLSAVIQNVALDIDWKDFTADLQSNYKVVEYLALANVLICSRCMGIGHFQKNCPQGSSDMQNLW
jgi:hypothetical protein